MDVSEVKNAPIATPEHMLGKGAMMPFNCTNSGVRKLMFGVNLEQRLPLMEPDVAYVSTGFEEQFGKYSSSFETASKDLTIVAKIPKFSNHQNHHYYLIAIDSSGLELSLIERSSYKHITESYGYFYNTDTLDFLQKGSKLNEGCVVHKSKAFDEYNNRMDGKNLLLMFNSSEQTMEDAIIISESCSKKLASPLLHRVKIMLNDNDIPLNIYGDINNYKSFPDIGESIKNNIFCAIRREKKEECLYSQSFIRLMEPTVSDEKITLDGKLIDLDIYCNNPDKFVDSPYYGQVQFYYDEHLRFCHDIVDAVAPYLEHGAKMTYDLQKLYHNCLDEINGKQFFSERAFSGITMEITVVEVIPADKGDKLTNRYGGKGVIAAVKPDHLMPKTYDGETIDILANMCGVYGRENCGQLFELSINHIAANIAKAMSDDSLPLEECVSAYLDFLEIVSPSMHKEVSRMVELSSDDSIAYYMSSIAEERIIYTDINPASETMTIDKLDQLYKRFPWITQEYLTVPIMDSNNKIQYVNTRRPVVYGHVYYYRLKQHSKEKFSATSLSATNIRNENSRNKANKVYKAPFSRTPIRFGDMEMGNMIHMGSDLVVQILMLYSASPEGRSLYEQMITGDPFKVDVQLNDTASNRNVEILNTYLKTIGTRLVFRKKPKLKKFPVTFTPVRFRVKKNEYHPVKFYHPDETKDPKDLERLLRLNKTKEYWPVTFEPVLFLRDPYSDDDKKKDE